MYNRIIFSSTLIIYRLLLNESPSIIFRSVGLILSSAAMLSMKSLRSAQPPCSWRTSRWLFNIDWVLQCLYITWDLLRVSLLTVVFTPL